jgi:hypothetical protein
LRGDDNPPSNLELFGNVVHGISRVRFEALRQHLCNATLPQSRAQSHLR